MQSWGQRMAGDLIGDIFGAGGVAGLVKDVVDKIWPDKTEQEKAQIALQLQESQMGQALAQAQMAVNQAEAANTNIFVSGWRPFIGWICGAELAYSGIVGPFLVFIARIAGYHGEVPTIDLGSSATILSALLGIPAIGLRTYEKRIGAVGVEPSH